MFMKESVSLFVFRIVFQMYFQCVVFYVKTSENLLVVILVLLKTYFGLIEIPYFVLKLCGTHF